MARDDFNKVWRSRTENSPPLPREFLPCAHLDVGWCWPCVTETTARDVRAALDDLDVDVIARAIHAVIYGGHAVEACPSFDAKTQTLGGVSWVAAEAVVAALKVKP